MKSLASIGAMLLLGCGGGVESESGAANGVGAGGTGTSSGTSTTTTAQGASAGDGGTGGSGGLLLGGNGGGTTTSTTECPIVLDEDYHVSIVISGLAKGFYGSCSDQDLSGPYAYMFYPKGVGHGFVIQACAQQEPGESSPPQIDLFVNTPEMPDAVTSIDYADGFGNLATTETGITNFTVFGETWQDVVGNFQGQVTAQDGGNPQDLEGSFRVCRRPDMVAP